jgi:hypothetical protein
MRAFLTVSAKQDEIPDADVMAGIEFCRKQRKVFSGYFFSLVLLFVVNTE